MHRLRNLEPRDLPLLWHFAKAQNRRDGTNYPVPRIFEMDESKPGFGQLLPNIPVALATERDGRVRQVHICVRTIEVMGWGGGREDMDFSALHMPMMFDLLKRRGYDDAHTFVPNLRATPEHCKLLETYGMTRIDHRLATFFKEL